MAYPASPPPPYNQITGLYTQIDKHANVSLATMDGNARPGQLVVDTSNYALYIGNADGNLNIVGSGGGGGGSPGGANTQLQFNNSGSFGGSANLTFNATTNTLSSGNNITAANTITSANSVTGNATVNTDLNTYNLTATGTVTVASGAAFAVNGNVTSSLLPDVTATPDLGSVTQPWSNAWIGNTTVSGTSAFGGLVGNVISVSTNTTLTTSNYYVLVTANATITLSAAEQGRMFYIKNARNAAANIVIQPAAGTIDGNANATLTTNFSSVMVISDGTNWYLN